MTYRVYRLQRCEKSIDAASDSTLVENHLPRLAPLLFRRNLVLKPLGNVGRLQCAEGQTTDVQLVARRDSREAHVQTRPSERLAFSTENDFLTEKELSEGEF